MDRSPGTASLKPVLGFTAAYVLAAAAIAFAIGNGEFVFYIAVMLVLIGAIALVHRRAHLSTALLWCLSTWGLLHMAGGLVPMPEPLPVHGPNRVLYSLWIIPGYLKYDQVVHAFGFGATTWLCWQGLRAAVDQRPGQTSLQPTAGPLVLCAAAGMGFGALNEVIEFIATLTMPDTNVGGYANTGWDLVANLVGCGIATILIRRSAPSAPKA